MKFLIFKGETKLIVHLFKVEAVSIKVFIIKNYNIYTIRNIHKEHFLKQ